MGHTLADAPLPTPGGPPRPHPRATPSPRHQIELQLPTIAHRPARNLITKYRLRNRLFRISIDATASVERQDVAPSSSHHSPPSRPRRGGHERWSLRERRADARMERNLQSSSCKHCPNSSQADACLRAFTIRAPKRFAGAYLSAARSQTLARYVDAPRTDLVQIDDAIVAEKCHAALQGIFRRGSPSKSLWASDVGCCPSGVEGSRHSWIGLRSTCSFRSEKARATPRYGPWSGRNPTTK